MKTLVITLMLSTLGFAGPKTGGGPIHTLYRAVCYIRDNPQDLPRYEVFVGFADSNRNNAVQILTDLETQPKVVRELTVSQHFRQQRGTHELYLGNDFSLDIFLDQRLPGGGGIPGSFHGSISGETIERPAECSVFEK